LPIRSLTKIYDVPEIGNDSEAVLLFSSGSTRIPKAIPLSHKNIIGNCVQLSGSGIGIGYSHCCHVSNFPQFRAYCQHMVCADDEIEGSYSRQSTGIQKNCQCNL